MSDGGLANARKPAAIASVEPVETASLYAVSRAVDFFFVGYVT